MGVFNWILDSMVRESGQTPRDRAIQLVFVKAEKVDVRFSLFFRGILKYNPL